MSRAARSECLVGVPHSVCVVRFGVPEYHSIPDAAMPYGSLHSACGVPPMDEAYVYWNPNAMFVRATSACAAALPADDARMACSGCEAGP